MTKLLSSFLKRVFLSDQSTKVQLMAALVFAALLPAMLINVFYHAEMNTFIRNKIETYNTEILRQAGEKLDSLLTQAEITRTQVISLSFNSGVFEDYEGKEMLEKIRIRRQIENTFSVIRRSFSAISDIYLVCFDNEVYSANWDLNREKLIQKDWIRDLFQREDISSLFITTHNADYYDINISNMPVISFVERIDWHDRKVKGIVQVDLKYTEFKKIFDSLNINKKNYIFLLDEEDRIIFSSDDTNIGSGPDSVDFKALNCEYTGGLVKSRNNETMVVNCMLSSRDWKIVEIIPTVEDFQEIRYASNMSLIIAAVSIMISLIMAYLLSNGITKPITKVVGKMKEVGDGALNNEMAVIGNRDLKVLISSFNRMIERIDALMKKVVEKETEKTNAQLRALQAQINPHFLYNTLDVIRGIAVENQVDSIAEISYNLSRMFRYSIYKDMEIVEIEEEIKHIKYYVIIQKYRHGNKLNMKYDIEKDVLKCKIIRLTIQPLVENAVYHGIEKKAGNGEIVLKIYKSEGGIVISVSDNGLGMSSEKVERLQAALAGDDAVYTPERDSGMGIGIMNVNTRLKLFYGSNYGLTIESRLNEGTEVRVHIPEIH